jgi:hypothetical protein
MAAAENIVHLLCPSGQTSYRKSAERIVTQASKSTLAAAGSYARQFASLFSQLRSDVERGLVGSIAVAAQAEALDDLLGHAAIYLREKRKEGAGVLSTAVFEDTIRRIVRSTGEDPTGKTLDPLINALVQSDTITGIVAKRCRAAAGVRNSALHANWEEFTLDDVGAVVTLTRELLSQHMA